MGDTKSCLTLVKTRNLITNVSINCKNIFSSEIISSYLIKIKKVGSSLSICYFIYYHLTYYCEKFDLYPFQNENIYMELKTFLQHLYT